MSERAPTTGTSPGPEASSTETAGLRDDAHNLTAALATENTENASPNQERSESMEQANPLELSREEQTTKVRLESLKELKNGAHEAITPTINNLNVRLDRARNGRDKLVKKALLLERREGAKQRKSARLEAKLEKATPGTMRQRRLLRKYGKTNRKLGEVQAHISRLDGAEDARTTERERKKRLRDKEVQLRHDMLKIQKKVALEKKNRRHVTKEMKGATNEQQREWLKQEMKSWPSIGKFREGLIDEAMKKYKNPITAANQQLRQGDYDLAA